MIWPHKDPALSMNWFILIRLVVSILIVKYFKYHLCVYFTGKKFEIRIKFLNKQTYK